jgi:hypothetical protein
MENRPIRMVETCPSSIPTQTTGINLIARPMTGSFEQQPVNDDTTRHVMEREIVFRPNMSDPVSGLLV